MIRRRLDKLVGLDARTKELIASIEKVVIDATDVRHFREQLDVYQDEIRENIASMNAILEGVLSRSAYQSSTNALNQPISYSKEQLSFLQESYRKAIFKATRHLETMERDQLMRQSTDSQLTAMGGVDNLADAYETSLELTRDMTTYARRLADEVKLGAINAELLEDSSNQIASNFTELKDMSGHVGQSKRLTSLAYRRRLTSYVLYTLAFTFYFLSAASIFLSRVPLGSWLLPSSYH
ncbi:Protein transport protein SEC20 [Fasciola gigantica]|uniref:Protein transport protein SEC20 n=1 Tax=Fasciola gigantica TaxID=46835 RepID=A0A504Z4E0_FASGI|nr:Protein transport protein SEC20 [Fasciola gigantica]